MWSELSRDAEMSVVSIFSYLFGVAFLSALGSLLPLFKKLERWHLRIAISFGAGVLLSTAFIHILPAISAPLGDQVGVPILTGFLVIYLLEKFVMVHPCEEGDCSFHKVGTAAFWGISFHSLLDGVALGASLAFPPLTLAVFLAIVIHKVPSAISLSSILMYDGAYSREKIIKLSLLFSLTTPIGAILSWTLLGELPQSVLFVAMGFSMGTFLSISISDLLPQVHRGEWGEKAGNITALFFGIFVIWFASFEVLH